MRAKATNKKPDITAQAKALSNSLIDLMKGMQNNVLNLQEKEAKALGIDMDALNKEAKEKVNELTLSMKQFENKLRGL